MSAVRLLLLLLLPWCIDGFSSTMTWGSSGQQNVTTQRTVAIRSQRDISANITIDQLSSRGFSLSTVLFDQYGYTTPGIQALYDVLTYGAETVVVDLYWNEGLNKFQLCPVAFDNSVDDFLNSTVRYFEDNGKTYKCEVGLSLNTLFEAIAAYLTASDTNLNGNLITLLFNIFQIGEALTYTPSLVGTRNDTLSSVLSAYFGNKLYTPTLLQVDRDNGVTGSSEGYPMLGYFLFQEKKRILGANWRTELASNSTYNIDADSVTVFSPSYFNSFTSLDMTSLSNFTSRELIPWRYSFDSEANPFTNTSMTIVVNQGYSPLLNHSVTDLTEMNALFNASLWSWASSEPLNEGAAREQSSNNGDILLKEAFRCAVLDENSRWSVANCYDTHYSACRSEDGDFDWTITDTQNTYFHSGDACSLLEGNYTFDVPKTALEQTFLSQLMTSKNTNGSIWIDMNSIAIADCWVTGGPYAGCPYQKADSLRNFAQMMTTAAVIILVFIMIIFVLRFRKVPVLKNRKHWRHIEKEKTEGESEGVPS